MDSLGETLENIGLSQEIQKGLAANLQKKPDFKALEGETAPALREGREVLGALGASVDAVVDAPPLADESGER